MELESAQQFLKGKTILVTGATGFLAKAYVRGEAYNEKVIKEEPLKMGQTIKGNSKLDIESEKEMMEKRMNELEADNVGGEALTSAMRDYGIERANLYGWPNTYVFTKAMGEMILSTYKDNVPLIIRPSIITSTIKEPFPGWIEAFRTVDSVIGSHGKGTISNFLGDPKTIVAMIPVDMVTNCMVAAMVTHSFNKDSSGNFIYHVCSSSRNPLRLLNVSEFSNLFFSKHPLTSKNGEPIMTSKLRFATNLDFQTHMMIRYVLPLKVLNLGNKAFFQIFNDWYSVNEKKVQLTIRMAKIYKPYAFFKAVFDVTNTENLYMATKMRNVEFDPKSIDWTDYMMNVHIPGLIKFVIKLSPKL